MTDAVTGTEKQPRGLYLLFTVEMWERFSFYGMRAFLVLFLVSTTGGGFGWSKEQASFLYGWYGGLVYLTPLLGGYLADRVLGTHRAVVFGSLVIAAGHFCLAVPGKVTFFVGLSLVVLGTGFHKSNISTMVGQLFRQGDRRRDAAFTIFHMGINVGAFLGPFVCGGLAESPRFGWHWGFGAAGVGMVLATAFYVALKRRFLGDIGDQPPRRRPDRTAQAAVAAPNEPLAREDKERIAALGLLAFFNVFFWVAYEQAGSSMNFFALERTDRMILGQFELHASWFQSINPIAIIIFAPAFAALWIALGRRGREPSAPIKFVWALVLAALGFTVMVAAAKLSEGGQKVGPQWLIAAYVLLTWGELCLYPVGLSTVTKLAPARFASLMMGLWFLSFSIADLSAGLLAGRSERFEQGQDFGLFGGLADFFLMFVIAPVLAALVLWALSGKIKRLMHGRA
jgi:proton-dependent oligopeptide transporter, POT family